MKVNNRGIRVLMESLSGLMMLNSRVESGGLRVRALIAPLVVAFLLTGMALGGADSLQPREAVPWPIVCVELPAGSGIEQTSGRAGGMLRALYGDGGSIVRHEPDGSKRVLTESFHSACEFDLSFDAQRILFAAKREPADPWGIWEMSADGSGAKRITQLSANCRTPAYQTTFYTIVSTEPWYQIMFSSDLAGALNERGSGPAYSLYSCRLNGSSVRRLTVNLSDSFDPYLKPDGRVLLSSWQRADLRRGLLGRVALFGVNADGTDYSLFCGDLGRRVKHMSCVTTNGLAVFVEGDRVPWDGAGQLGSVRLRRSHHSYQSLTNDANLLYHSPSAIPDGTILVSSRPAAGDTPHAIFRFDPKTGRRERLLGSADVHYIHAKALTPRQEPDGRSSVVDEGRLTGKLYGLNTYIADADMMPHLKPGMFKKLRVIEGVPLPASGRSDRANNGARLGSMARKRLLGVVDVMPDGSFYVEVPADIPIQLQLLDEQGLALETCGWVWAKPREPRGCIGCHEDPELTPPNRLVEALRKPGVELTPSVEDRRSVDFARDVMPIIKAKCSGCHDSASTGIDLRGEPRERFNQTYENLMLGVSSAEESDEEVVGRYVHPGRARTSPLVWRLWGKNTSRPWDGDYHGQPWSTICPPAGAAPLTQEEKRLVAEWIDLGAHWKGVPETPTSSPTSDTERGD